MIFLNQHHPSLPQKLLMTVMFLTAACLSLNFEFHSALRKILVMACVFIYLVRYFFMIFVFFKRRLTWRETVLGSIFMPGVILALSFYGSMMHRGVGLVEIIGLALYLAGSIISTVSEGQRYRFKRDPDHQGKLYTGGLFKLARHINYFGDSLLFAGWALVAGDPVLLFIPLIMTINFIILSIPLQERHLARKYPAEIAAYKASAKRLIPFVY